uniref:HMG box domain-containing protein n=1 Tax=Anopheles dirus TaxID=7168 RepID=A0A182MYB2_9DIPT
MRTWDWGVKTADCWLLRDRCTDTIFLSIYPRTHTHTNVGGGVPITDITSGGIQHHRPIDGYKSFLDAGTARLRTYVASGSPSGQYGGTHHSLQQQLNHQQPQSLQGQSGKWEEPYFDDTTPTNVTGLVGKSAYLSCRVKNLGNKTLNMMQPHNSAQVQGSPSGNKTAMGDSPGGKGKQRGKPRGRNTAYSYFVQTCREEHKKMFPEQQIVFASFSRQCGERWKTMMEAEKQRFHEMAEKDKTRYDLEMQHFVSAKGMPTGRVTKRKQLKDPNAPKRPLTAFFLYTRDERDKVKAENPELGVGAIAKQLGRMWSVIPAEIKQQYLTKAQQDKHRYEQELASYERDKANKAAGVSATAGLNLPVPQGQAGAGGFQNLPADVQQAVSFHLQAQAMQTQQPGAVAGASTSQLQSYEEDESDEMSDEEDSDEHRDIHILTVGSYTYTSDQRFQATHHKNIDDWTLQIKWAQKRDAGIYECQISTQPVRSYFVTLSVVGKSKLRS